MSIEYEYTDSVILGVNITIIRTFQTELPKVIQDILERHHRPKGPVAFINIVPGFITVEVHDSLMGLFMNFNSDNYVWTRNSVVIS